MTDDIFATDDRTTRASKSRRSGGMHPQRLAWAVAAPVGILGTFLPWASVPFGGAVRGTELDGWITLLLLLPAAVLAFLGATHRRLDFPALLGGSISGALAAALAAYNMLQVSSLEQDLGVLGQLTERVAGGFGVGVGVIAVALAGLAIPAAGFLLQDRT